MSSDPQLDKLAEEDPIPIIIGLLLGLGISIWGFLSFLEHQALIHP